jgi:hypothetical protein
LRFEVKRAADTVLMESTVHGHPETHAAAPPGCGGVRRTAPGGLVLNPYPFGASGRGESGDIFTSDRVYRHLTSLCPLLQTHGENQGRTFLHVIRYRCPRIAKKQPYRSNGDPAGIAWRGCCEGMAGAGGWDEFQAKRDARDCTRALQISEIAYVDSRMV